MTSPRRGARIAAFATAATVVVSPLAMSATAAPELQLDQSRKTYIVQLDDAPIASYTGGVAGIPATKPAKGEKVDTESRNARAYEVHLRNEHAKALRRAGLPTEAKVHEFTVALNGFTADLTAVEAAKLSKSPDVVQVWEDEIRYADTATPPTTSG
ncbi:protease inhibitor I9 family protein [Ornithinimicrobium sp. W1665]|uniref:protease inhibitor I9 family protein n=1 Tax=Ornithinimicrobium sp. W1665 TaxID=3416666 RepID=UPI003D6A3653